VPALERVLLVHRGLVDRGLERAEAVARIAGARRRAELAEMGIHVAVAAAAELQPLERRGMPRKGPWQLLHSTVVCAPRSGYRVFS